MGMMIFKSGWVTASLCTVAVDPQKQAKMLAQFWRRFHNDGIAVSPAFSSLSSALNTCRVMHR